MAKYIEGQRVRVPKYHHHAPLDLWGRYGNVTFVGPTIQMAGENIDPQQVEQQYMVRFDGETEDRIMWESDLEPVDKNELI